MEFYAFPEAVGYVIIPTDELIFFGGVGTPQASYDEPQTYDIYGYLWISTSDGIDVL